MTNRFRVIFKYTTCTSPIIPLSAFQKFCISIVSKLSWGGLIPRRNEKQRLRKFFLFLGGGGGWGKQGALWEMYKWRMKDFNKSLHYTKIFNIIFHFKVCVGVSRRIKHSNPRYVGHFLFFLLLFFLMFRVKWAFAIR